MLVRFTNTIPGGEKRGFIEGREFDWPMMLVNKFRKDYGPNVLVPTGANADRIARIDARRITRVGEKPTRQERLGLESMQPGEPSEGNELLRTVGDSVALATAQAVAGYVEPGTEAPVVAVEAEEPALPRRGPGRPRKMPVEAGSV